MLTYLAIGLVVHFVAVLFDRIVLRLHTHTFRTMLVNMIVWPFVLFILVGCIVAFVRGFLSVTFACFRGPKAFRAAFGKLKSVLRRRKATAAPFLLQLTKSK